MQDTRILLELIINFLGFGSDVAANNRTNTTAIGNGAVVTNSNTMYLGNAALTSVNIVAGAVYNGSDGRFKTNVTENVKGLEFIKKLRPVTYNINTNAFDDFIIQNMPDSLKQLHKNGMDFTGSTEIVHSGFIAQEVEQAAQQTNFVSSIVHHPANESDPYSIAYSEIVVPLVKAVQELSKTSDSLSQGLIAAKAQISNQDSINSFLLNQINQLITSMNACCSAQNERSMQLSPTQTAANQTDVDISNKNIIILDQNAPNPFAEQTVISYYLPNSFTRAQIIFLDQSGKLIKAVDLTEKGKGQLNVFANDLTNGIYTYSLIVDGQTMETKKMMKTK